VIVCTLGDVLLDVIVRLERPLQPGDDVGARTELRAGGQAANVAAWVAALGGQARWIGRRGGDGTAALTEAQLAARGVEMLGPRAGRSGVVVSIVGPDRDRSMASDRGAGAQLDVADLRDEWFADCGWLHVSGYTLSRRGGAAAAEAAARIARSAGASVSVDAASATLIAATGGALFRERIGALHPEVVFATVAELRALGGPWRGATTVVKRGAGGCTVVSDARREELPAVPADAVDATGAGDAFAAGYLLGGAALALQAGARCVAIVGAMP
jgi:sugar/nucleoside kinase (ribokinase family)